MSVRSSSRDTLLLWIAPQQRPRRPADIASPKNCTSHWCKPRGPTCERVL